MWEEIYILSIFIKFYEEWSSGYIFSSKDKMISHTSSIGICSLVRDHLTHSWIFQFLDEHFELHICEIVLKPTFEHLGKFCWFFQNGVNRSQLSLSTSEFLRINFLVLDCYYIGMNEQCYSGIFLHSYFHCSEIREFSSC